MDPSSTPLPARPEELSIVILSSIDGIARQSASIGLLLDLPAAVVVSHDLVRQEDGTKGVRRVITDTSGPVAEEVLPLDHDCVACTVREDLVPTLQMLVAAERWQSVIVSAPLTTSPEQIAYVIDQAINDGSLSDAHLAPVVSLVDLDSLVDDLLGDDLLTERDLAIGESDRRSVGEALANQIEFADVVITLGTGDRQAEELLHHVIAPTTMLEIGWHRVDARNLITQRHDASRARRRIDPLTIAAFRTETAHQVWTLDLQSSRPLHPGRLLEEIERLGSGRIRARGHFWLPSRPDTVCVWDGSGGQLSIGEHGPWGDRHRQTRLVITGVDAEDRDRIEHTFRTALMTADELRTSDHWAGTDDGFAPWLGDNLRPHHP